MKKTLLLMSLLVPSWGFCANSMFTLESPDIPNKSHITEAQVFDGFGCHGKNISPALLWENAPPGTKSFALLAFDPDAPTGSGWWHWIVYNIPLGITAFPSGVGAADSRALPSGTVQGVTDFGNRGYGGPCPPVGDPAHRYIFTLHALKIKKLDVPAGATPAMVRFEINQNTIDKAAFTGYYSRSK